MGLNVERDPAKGRFVKAWIRLFTVLHRYNAYLLRRYGLSGIQLGLLRQLEIFGPLSLSELSKVHPSCPSGMSQLVDRLVESGWIERRRSEEDRRRIMISLTKRAKKLLSKEPPLGPARALREMDRMNPREKKKLAEAMEFVVNAMLGDRTGERVTGKKEGKLRKPERAKKRRNKT